MRAFFYFGPDKPGVRKTGLLGSKVPRQGRSMYT